MKRIFTLLTFAIIAMNASAQMTTVAVRYNLSDDLMREGVSITVPALEFSVGVPLTSGGGPLWLSGGATASVCAGLRDGSQVTHSRLFGDVSLNISAGNAVVFYGGAGFGVSNTTDRRLRSNYTGNGERYSLARAQAGAIVSFNGWGVNVNVSTEGIVGFGLVISVPAKGQGAAKAAPAPASAPSSVRNTAAVSGGSNSMKFYRDGNCQLCVRMGE